MNTFMLILEEHLLFECITPHQIVMATPRYLTNRVRAKKKYIFIKAKLFYFKDYFFSNVESKATL